VAVLGLVLRGEWRRQRRAWLVLALLVAVMSGVVLAAGAAGRSTDNAFARYDAAHGYDAYLFSTLPIPWLGSLPDVRSVTDLNIPAGGNPRCDSCRRPINDSDFSVYELSTPGLAHMAKLVSGRMPDPGRPDEVLASFTLQRDAGVHVGSVVSIPLASRAQEAQFETQGNLGRFDGPTVRLRVVGIEAALQEFPATQTVSYDLFATPAFARLYGGRTLWLHAYFVQLHGGMAELPRFEALVRARRSDLSLVDLDTQAQAIAAAIHPQAVGWSLLAGLSALLGALVIAQALARQAPAQSDAFLTLSALGVRRRQLVLVGLLRTLGIAVVGVGAGVVLAFVLSPLTPVGEARLADPSPGFSFDPLVLLLGALGAVAVVVALGFWPAVRSARVVVPGGEVPPLQRSRAVAVVSASSAPAPVLIGVRHALERTPTRRGAPVGTALLGAILAVTALCATAVFGASLAHLTTTPALYGQPFDEWLSIGTFPGETQSAAAVRQLERVPGLAAVTIGIAADVTIDGRAINALAGQSLRGHLLLTPISGHEPQGPHQVSLGVKTMRELGTHVGGTVRVTIPQPSGGNRTATFTVVGATTFPPDFGTAGLGNGAVFALAAIPGAACPPGRTQIPCLVRAVTESSGALLVRGTPGPVGSAEIHRLSRRYSSVLNVPSTPENLVNFGQAVNFPLLFGVVLIVFGMATLLHVLVVSVGERRQEAGLLKALGFVRRQVAAAVLWQAATVALVGIVVGVPAGIVIGRLVWRLFAGNLGVLPVPVVVDWVIAAIAAGTLAVAVALALGPARAAARCPAAQVMRAP
jgi:ABC-type lipoprotein release transport system permease subunit